MSKTIAILQSNYIPWKGYFDLINMVDEFILYDDVQYTKNDWRNRNIVKTANGTQWLTIPTHGSTNLLIKDTKVANPKWSIKHWKTLENNYSKAEFFEQYESIFRNLYLKSQELIYLSEINFLFIKSICNILNIKTKLSWSMEYNIENCDKVERVLKLCQAVGATHYISGPAARSYLDEEMFSTTGIKLGYVDYSSYPIYRQLHGEFIHTVSILDLIFNEGPQATRFMKSFN